MTEQEVAEFVMADSEHLAIALNIRKVMESLPKMLIEGVLTIVATEIRKDLGDTSEWNVSLMNDADPMKANADLLNVRHAAWPDVYVGLSPSVSQCRNIVAGVWSDPDKNALTGVQREALHRALTDDPYRLKRKADAWWTAWADLNDLGFLSDFGDREFLEFARKIRQNEAGENAFVIKLGCTLANIARKVNEVLHPA
jgi:hypothetical protein